MTRSKMTVSITTGNAKPDVQRYKFVIRGIPIEAYDYKGSEAAWWVASELQDDNYGVEAIAFNANDVVIDVGGHIGLFSIYMGLRFPDIVIHSFEPFPANYELFRHNLMLNRVNNVQLHPFALSRDARDLEMVTDPTNSGAATCNSMTLRCSPSGSIPSMTLDQVFDSFNIATCKLLKIDCEGSEYEILQSTRVLSRVRHLSGEAHMNRFLSSQGYSLERLLGHCERHIERDKILLRFCIINE